MGAKCRARSLSSRCKGRAHAISLGAVRAALRLMQRSCGSARHQRSAVQTSWPAHLRHRSSKVRLRRGQTWPLFRKGLQASAGVSDSPLLNSQAVQRPCHFLVSSSQTLPGVQDTALRFRSGPLAQTVSVIANLFGSIRRRPESALPVTDCAGFSVFPGLTANNVFPPFHRSLRISDVAAYFYSWASACERGDLYPAQTSVPRSLLWAVPAQAPEAVCPPHGPLSLSAVWSLRSPARWPAKASSHPALPDRLRDRHFASLRVIGHWQTCRQRPHRG